jgi:hypothetical protein
MNRPFPHFDVARLARPEGMIPAIASSAKRSNVNRQVRLGRDGVINLPKRPDLTVLSESIPLFYIGQHRQGFWVARESEGQSGGLFIFRRSALRFARRQSAPSGCALMVINESLELDVENGGSRAVEQLAAAMDLVRRRVLTFAADVGMAVTEWRKLVSEISRINAAGRRNRDAIERELFHGQYTLSSKNDDDLPIP